MSIVPERDPERPQDDPWDTDAVRYLLSAGGEALGWTRGALMECLRAQPARRRREPERVTAAAELANRFGVELRTERRGAQEIVHLYRTDPQAPEYPRSPFERRGLLRAQRDGDIDRLCRRCGHLGVKIVYGFPSASLFEAAERGEVALGGCMIWDDAADTRCMSCGHAWG